MLNNPDLSLNDYITPERITKSYRSFAFRSHPDKISHLSEREKESLTNSFISCLLCGSSQLFLGLLKSTI